MILALIGNSGYEVSADRKIPCRGGIICENGGTPININTCLCPGGLIGKYCKPLKFTWKNGCLKNDKLYIFLWAINLKIINII